MVSSGNRKCGKKATGGRFWILIPIAWLIMELTTTTTVTTATPTPTGSENCKILISEILINIHTGVFPKDFIELQSICDGNQIASLFGYKVVIFSSTSGTNAATAAIVGVINAHTHKFRSGSQYFTIGGSCVKNKDMGLQENLFAVRWRGTRSLASFMPQQLNLHQSFKDGEIKFPYAIAVVKFKKEEMADMAKISLASGSEEKVLDTTMEQLIRDHLEDLIIFRHDSTVTECGIFERICPQMQGKNYIIRNYARHREEEKGQEVETTRQPGPSVNPTQATRNVGGRPSALQKSASNAKESQRKMTSFFTMAPAGRTCSAVDSSYNTAANSRDCSPTPLQQHQPVVGRAQAEDTEKIKIPLSISRCTEGSDAFVPEVFKATNPTAGLPNDCICGLPILLLQEDNAEQRVRELPGDGECSVQVDAVAVDPGEDDGVGQVQNTNSEDLEKSEIILNILRVADSRSSLPEFLTSEARTEIYNIILAEQTKYFKSTASATSTAAERQEEQRKLTQKNQRWNNMLNEMKKNDKVNLKWTTDNKEGKIRLFDWLEYLPGSRPEVSRIRCKVCMDGANTPGLVQGHRNEIAKDAGQVFHSKDDYRIKLQKHVLSDWHVKIVAKNTKDAAMRSAGSLDAMNKRQIQSLLQEDQGTARMLLLVYSEIKMHLSFRSHPKLIKTLEHLGVSNTLGFCHHKDATGARKMAIFIGEAMQKTFLQKLTASASPVGLILDTAVDTMSNDYLSLQIQLLEDNFPVVYLYRMIPLSVDHTASGQLQLIHATMVADSTKYSVPDLWEYLRQNLVALTTDGASVYTGRHGGLGVLLSESLFGDKERLFRVHCYAHQLQLMTRKTVHSVQELMEFENTIRSIAQFYNSRNSRNYAHLKAAAETLHLDISRITYIFDERWCTNAQLVLRRIKVTLPALLNDLPAIIADGANFNPETRAIAQGIYSKITDVTFHFCLHLITDIVTQLSDFGRKFQESGGVILGKGFVSEDLYQAINTLQLDPDDGGPRLGLSAFIAKLRCRKDELSTYVPCRNWKKVDDSITYKWDFKSGHVFDLQRGPMPDVLGQRMLRQGDVRPPGKCQHLRDVTLTKMLAEIEKQFPEKDQYKNIDILHPRNFRPEAMKQMTYGHHEIQQLANRFNMPQPATLDEFKLAMSSIPDRLDYATLTLPKYSARYFWKSVLSDESFVIGTNFRRLIKIILAIPSSSADAERSFSILKFVKSPRRNSMQDSMLDTVLRININGVDDLALFPHAKLALEWKNKHHATGSKKSFGGGSSSKRDLELDEEDQQCVPPKRMAIPSSSTSTLGGSTSSSQSGSTSSTQGAGTSLNQQQKEQNEIILVDQIRDEDILLPNDEEVVSDVSAEERMLSRPRIVL